MKKIKAFFALLFFAVTPLWAQIDVTVVDDEESTSQTIDLPDAMTLRADSLLQEWNARQYLYPDTACDNPDYNPTYTTEEFIERLGRMPVVMEMPHNAVVQKFIDQYTGRLRRSVSIILGTANFYIPIFEEALDYYGLPLELKYLPVVESALDPLAVSRAGAVGL